MKKTFCDRCTEPVEESQDGSTPDISLRIRIKMTPMKGDPLWAWQERDLCKACLAFLTRWLKERA